MNRHEENDFVRRLSLDLFSKIKPKCISLSEITLVSGEHLNSDSSHLVLTLRALTDELHKHHDNFDGESYIISTKLADYIFFPISSILKQPSLSDDATEQIFRIITFLLEYSWSNDPNPSLIDQLYSLIVFLSGGAGASRNNVQPAFLHHGFSFKHAAIGTLSAIAKCIPRHYFGSLDVRKKRLALLGDTTTIFVEFLSDLPSPLNQDENNTASFLLDSLKGLYQSRVDPESTALVLPGVVSGVTKFALLKKNLHFTTIVSIFNLLSVFITRVFDDESLKINLEQAELDVPNLKSMQSLLESSNDGGNSAWSVSPRFVLEDEQQIRSSKWLSETTKQLKLTLMSLFKFLLFNLNIRSKISNHRSLQNCLFEFFEKLTQSCFKSLISELILTATDIVPTLIYVILDEKSNREHERILLLEKGIKVFIIEDHSALMIFEKQVKLKLEDLVLNQLPRVMSSVSEENIQICLLCIEFHFKLVEKLSTVCLGSKDVLLSIKRRLLGIMRNSIIKLFEKDEKESKMGKNYDLFSNSELTSDADQNRLDNVLLPPSINAKKVTNMSTNRNPIHQSSSSQNVIKTSDDWKIKTDFFSDSLSELEYFPEIFSTQVERSIALLLKSLGRDNDNLDELVLGLSSEENNGASESSHTLVKSITLWILKNLTSSVAEKKKVDLGEFLVDFELSQGEETVSDESISLFITEVHDSLEFVTENLQVDASTLNYASPTTVERSFAIALNSIEGLSKILLKDQFQSEILINHLYALLEALTYKKGGIVERSARKALQTIVYQFYNGSITGLINDNSDYIIDSLSLNLSTASSLTPSVPEILFVILEISGLHLLETNQLYDILSEIFIIIDSFHGYSVLIENFFLVFRKVVSLILNRYSSELLDQNKLKNNEKKSNYSPWALSTRDEMLGLISDLNKQVDPFNGYEPGKEYFKRKANIPFDQQNSDEDDSDDENLDNEEPPEQEAPWTSPVPQNTYNIILHIFKYGLQLLTHPSTKLKLIVLHTLRETLPVVITSNSLVLPLLAEYWPVLLSLASGTQTVSNWENNENISENSQTMEATLELIIEILKQDSKHESFMGGRFLSMWEFLCQHNILFRGIKQETPRKGEIIKRSIPPRVNELYVEFLVTGMMIYERTIPDLIILEMLRACIRLGINEGNFILSRDLHNALWACRNVSQIHS